MSSELRGPSFADAFNAKKGQIRRVCSDCFDSKEDVPNLVEYHFFNKDKVVFSTLKGEELSQEIKLILSSPMESSQATSQALDDVVPAVTQSVADVGTRWIHISIDDKESLNSVGQLLGIKPEHYTNVEDFGWEAEFVAGEKSETDYLRIVAQELKFLHGLSTRHEKVIPVHSQPKPHQVAPEHHQRDVAEDLTLQEVLVLMFCFPDLGLLITVGATTHLSSMLDAAKGLLRNRKSILRNEWQMAEGASTLIVVFLDALMDVLLPVLEVYGDAIEGLYLINAEQPRSENVLLAHKMEAALHEIRRGCWDAKGLCIELKQNYSGALAKPGLLQIVIDATEQIEVQTDTYTQQCKSIENFYAVHQEKRMNATMGILARMSILFVPFQAMTGIWGMNFEDTMLELAWEHGYLLFWVLAGSWFSIALVWISNL